MSRTEMNAETLKELLANARSAPWTFGESQSPDGQEWMGCGIAASGNEFIWFEDDPDTDIPTARLIALAPQLAADNIALQAEVERLREALLPFAEYADECDEYRYDDFNQAPVTAGDCRQARAALNET